VRGVGEWSLEGALVDSEVGESQWLAALLPL
jgi:hypothetical protein